LEGGAPRRKAALARARERRNAVRPNVRIREPVKATVRKAALALFLAYVLAGSAPAQPIESIAWEPFTFDTPGGGRVAVERGWIEVPERHARPVGPKIRLPVIRVRSSSAKPGPPIVFLAGGPGDSGIRQATRSLYLSFDRLRAHGDVIGFDQRGTGMAEPSLEVPGRFDLPSDQQIDSPASRRRLSGIDLAAYNTSESADDVDELRRALGAEKVVLWAHSYGASATTYS
jgi:hypothetical protein